MVFFILYSILGLSFGTFRSSPETRCYRPNGKNSYSFAAKGGGRKLKAAVGKQEG